MLGLMVMWKERILNQKHHLPFKKHWNGFNLSWLRKSNGDDLFKNVWWSYLFAERGVEDSVFAELFSQSSRATENATKTHIFPKYIRTVIETERRLKQSGVVSPPLAVSSFLSLYLPVFLIGIIKSTIERRLKSSAATTESGGVATDDLTPYMKRRRRNEWKDQKALLCPARDPT